MKRLFNTLLNFGVEDSQSAYDKRRIKTVNLINLLVIICILLGYSNYFIIKSDFSFVQATGFLILSCISLYLNKIKRTAAAFLLFTFCINLAIFHINKYYPYETGAYLFYFPLIVSIILLNDPSFRDKFSLAHVLMCALFFSANLLFDFPDYQVQMTPVQIRLIWITDFIMASAITGILSFLLTRIIFNQNREIIGQNENLKRAKEVVNASLKEKEVLLAELHHRVKNNLAIISGLLNMQEDATANEEARQIISDSKTRIMSMALVHRMLYENSELKSINVGKYSSELIGELFNSYNLSGTVAINENYDTIMLPVSKSIPLGLILNEIVTNSIKYAFKPSLHKGGLFSVSIIKANNRVQMQVKDNGSGFSRDFNTNSQNMSLGIYLIKSLSEQLDGKVRFSNDNGAKIELDFAMN